MEIEEFIRQRGGVVKVGRLLDEYPRHLVIRAREGLLRPARGLVAVPGYRADVLTALRNNGVLTCISAAKDYGLWPNDTPDRPHLACNHSRATGVTVHRRFTDKPPAGLPLASMQDVVLHALGCLPRVQAVGIAESALRKGLDRQILLGHLQTSKLGTLRRRLEEADATAESYPELAMRLALRDHGVPFEAQARIPTLGRVDFLICGVLILEIDGFAYHSTRDAKRRDDERNNRAAALGYATLRYLPEFAQFQPEAVIADIKTVLTTLGVLRDDEDFPFLAA
ncbi:endonuclease domain-containing protein [Zafaria sp. Z1313]|uniref:endonuclease domain-containing protein n=1 Tax=unclassified Zafaria TaxID=2828765 RepID=UPI002E79D3C1|nr:DUF559 domain-containing protein [Zafaria sp. J156]MEE1620516.1 DUF559 domain-containing protein [Zafaria sp. J156]